MNKISKKIVALVTMAAFVLTLVPAAAFAGTANDVTISQKAVDSVNVDFDSTFSNVKINVTDADGDAVKVALQGSQGEDLSGNPAAAGTTSETVIASVTNAYEYRIPLSAGTYTISVVAGDQTLVSEEVYVYGEALRENSSYGVMDKNDQIVENTEVAVNKDLSTKFVVKDSNNVATEDVLGNVIVWAEENGQPSSYVKVDGQETGAKNGKTIANVKNGTPVTLTFTKAGTYTLCAGMGTDVDSAKKKPLLGTTTVTVTNKNVAVESITMTGSTQKYNTTALENTVDIDFGNTGMGRYDITGTDFEYNGLDKVVFQGTAKDENGLPLAGKTFAVSSDKAGVVEINDTPASEEPVMVTTDSKGNFKVEVRMQEKSNVGLSFYNEDADLEYVVNIIAAKTSAVNIDREKTGGYVLASTDKNWPAAGSDFSDAVQFKITDEKGNVVTDNTVNAKIEVMDKPTDADAKDLTGDQFKLVKSGDVYTLEYTGNNEANVKLVPGKYIVRVALDSGDNVTVSFNAVKFGKVEDMVIDMTAWNGIDLQQKPTDPGYKVTDEVTLGQIVTVKAKYVDANGIKVPATGEIQYGFDGKAVREVDAKNAVFGTALDIPANESLLGTTIKVKAYDVKNAKLVEKELTVVDSYNEYSLEFDPTNGPINEDNKVTVKIVDEDGNVANINKGTVYADVEDQTNADAKVSVKTVGTISNGKATLEVYSNKETTADIRVLVKAGSAIYVGNLEYTFGKEDPLANRTVVMTIGSSEYVVNNKVVTGDAAPFVDSNWRTMVPIRALAEAFDAEVEWDNDARTVTIAYDTGITIVMTVGEETYTVNDEEMTMDTAPVIQGDRTYVPVRFAAEGMGFTVTPLYDSNGLTASVVFQR